VNKPPKNYDEVIDWLYQQLPQFQTHGAVAFRPGLEKITRLTQYLGDPQKQYPTLHIGGTNGKGSTSHMMASVLQKAGYRVGLYTSPHLKDFRERIKINGQLITKGHVVDFIHQHFSFFLEQHPTFFELTVAMAFEIFKIEKVDIAVIEVGMGGRLDATNIVEPLLSIITNISLDHTQYLGTDRIQIAKEKAGIIKPHTPVIIGEKDPETAAVFESKAQAVYAPIFYSEDFELPKPLQTDLKGIYQYKNLQTTCTALQQLKGFEIAPDALENGLTQVAKTTGLMGRWQTISSAPKIIADVSHNEAGFGFLKAQLKGENFNKLHVIIGFVKDKDLKNILSFLPQEASYYLTQANVPRSLGVFDLEAIFKETTLRHSTHLSVAAALESAKDHAEKQDLILITGSTFVVAEIL